MSNIWKKDTLEARAKAGEAIEEYLRLHQRDALDHDDLTEWTEEELAESQIDGKFLTGWTAVGHFQALDDAADTLILNGHSGCSMALAKGMLVLAAEEI